VPLGETALAFTGDSEMGFDHENASLHRSELHDQVVASAMGVMSGDGCPEGVENPMVGLQARTRAPCGAQGANIHVGMPVTSVASSRRSSGATSLSGTSTRYNRRGGTCVKCKESFSNVK
jgi:hypothetical protein